MNRWIFGQNFLGFMNLVDPVEVPMDPAVNFSWVVNFKLKVPKVIVPS